MRFPKTELLGLQRIGVFFFGVVIEATGSAEGASGQFVAQAFLC